MMTIGLAYLAFRHEERLLVRFLAYGALAAVILQGLLGGLRVLLNARFGLELAMLHGTFAQLIFALLAGIALMTSKKWREAKPVEIEVAGKIRRMASSTSGLFGLQLIAGVYLRQAGVGFYVHIALAVALATHVLMLAIRILPAADRWGKMLAGPVMGLLGFIALQISLGVAAWWFGGGVGAVDDQPISPHLAILATAHVGVGALLLATSVVLTLRSYRHLAAPPKAIFLPLAASEGAV
jgi:cytochrome c oxidase assembly protein subunit 15